MATSTRYAAAKARIYHDCQVACVYNVEDPATRDDGRGGRGRRGLPGDRLHAGHPGRRHASASSTTCSPTGRSSRGAPATRPSWRASRDVPSGAPHNVANALAAAALGRAHGIGAAAVRAGLRSFELDAHRIATVADRSTASPTSTTRRRPTRTRRSRRFGRSTPSVWIAGRSGEGRRRSTTWSRASATGCAASSCSAPTATVIADALARHAPDVPVIDGRRHRHWGDGACRRCCSRRSPGRATRCCSRRRAPRSTCSRATRPAATRSPPRRCASVTSSRPVER